MRPIRPAAALVAASTAAALAALPATVTAQEAMAPVVETGIPVESFDGTIINTNVFLPGDASPDNPVPLVMRTHGWGGSGETAVGSGTLSKLLDAGYAVVTWDQRGFGQSGGDVEALKPDIEGADTSALLDFMVASYPILTDEAGDPVVGMSGGSYAGGIQTATSFLDDRIDAIAPEISWASLVRALYEGDVANLGWGSGLFAAGTATATGDGLAAGETGTLSPTIVQAYAELTATTQLQDSTLQFFRDSSLEVYTSDSERYGEAAVAIDVPALVMNGSVDTLFDATTGADIFHHVAATGTDAKYVVFCGGHVACPADYVDAGDRERMDDLLLEWFAVHLRGEQRDTGPAVEYRTNDGVWRASDDFDVAGDDALVAEGTGSIVQTGMVQVANPASAIFQAEPNADDLTGFSVEVAQATDGPLEIVGIPEITLDVAGIGDHAHLFSKLVHRETGHVLNLQETSLRIDGLATTSLDGPVTRSERMAGLAYTVPEGDHLDLQVSTVSLMHQTARVPAQLDVTATVTVPVLRDVVEAPPVADPVEPDEPDDDGDNDDDNDNGNSGKGKGKGKGQGNGNGNGNGGTPPGQDPDRVPPGQQPGATVVADDVLAAQAGLVAADGPPAGGDAGAVALGLLGLAVLAGTRLRRD